VLGQPSCYRSVTNAEKLEKIGPVVAEIFRVICQFFCLVQKGAVFTFIISGVTGQIFIKLAQDVGKILPLNIFESEWQYCNQFWNAAVPNEPKIDCRGIVIP